MKRACLFMVLTLAGTAVFVAGIAAHQMWMILLGYSIAVVTGVVSDVMKEGG